MNPKQSILGYPRFRIPKSWYIPHLANWSKKGDGSWTLRRFEKLQLFWLKRKGSVSCTRRSKNPHRNLPPGFFMVEKESVYIYLAVTESSWKYTYALLNATPSYVRDSCIDIWSYIHMITYVYIYIRYLIDIPLYPSQNPLFSILFWCAEIILTYECPITVPQNTAKDIHAFQDQRFLVERSCSFLMFIHCLSLFFSQYQTSIRKVYKCNSGGGNKCKACQPHGTRQARGM